MSTTEETKQQIIEEIGKVTNAWDEPLDEVHDIPPIANALMARFNIEAAS